MNTTEAISIVLRAAEANANGHEHCAEIKEACRVLRASDFDVDVLREIQLWIQRRLKDLHGRVTKGSGGVIVNSYVVAEVPDWELRQKLDLVVFALNGREARTDKDSSLVQTPQSSGALGLNGEPIL